jgi:hypothetical protein
MMSDAGPMRIACDAMCGGLARWLRALGHDTFYREGIDDAELVKIARREGRVLISSDGKMFERRAIAGGEVRALLLPHGLKLLDQVAFAVRELKLGVLDARCTRCNGPLVRASREEVSGEVPARSLVWAREFYRCAGCGKVFWDGTHWQRIEKVREACRHLP